MARQRALPRVEPECGRPSKNPVLCDGGRIRTAENVYQQLEWSFGTEAWRQTAEEKARAISRFSLKFMTGVIGQYLLFGVYDEDKDGDVIWLARAVADAELGGRCCKRIRRLLTSL